LLAIWRAAAVRPVHAVDQVNRVASFAGKPRSNNIRVASGKTRLLRPAGRTKNLANRLGSTPREQVEFYTMSLPLCRCRCFCPEGVGAVLAGDRPGTGRKPCHLGSTDPPQAQVLLPVPGRSSASRTPTPCGQKRRSRLHLSPSIPSAAPIAFDSAQRA
jgi:hypothetical protein